MLCNNKRSCTDEAAGRAGAKGHALHAGASFWSVSDVAFLCLGLRQADVALHGCAARMTHPHLLPPSIACVCTQSCSGWGTAAPLLFLAVHR